MHTVPSPQYLGHTYTTYMEHTYTKNVFVVYLNIQDICYKIVKYLKYQFIKWVSCSFICSIWWPFVGCGEKPDWVPWASQHTRVCTHESSFLGSHSGQQLEGRGGCQRGVVCLPTIPSLPGDGWASPFSQQEDTIIPILQVGRLSLGGFWDLLSVSDLLPNASLLPLAWVPTYLYWRWVNDSSGHPGAHWQVSGDEASWTMRAEWAYWSKAWPPCWMYHPVSC